MPRNVAWLLLAMAFAAACAKRGPRDVGNQNPRSEFAEGLGAAGAGRDASTDGAPRTIATPTPTGRKPRELVRAYSRALAIDATAVYFGDASDDTLCALDKAPAAGASREPRRIARRAPIAGGLALDAREAALAWIGSPGDIVLRVPVSGGVPTTIRDRGIFTDVAATGGDVFITEAQGGGGMLTRVTGSTAARLASFDGTPRGLVVDGSSVYVATSVLLASTTRTRGEVSELARGTAFASPQIDDTFLYATAIDPQNNHGRVVVRVKKSGGPLETLATGVRDAPIAIHRGLLYWFDAERPRLLAYSSDSAPATPASAQVISDDPWLERPNALAVDDDGAFVAAGSGEDARIVVISIR
jgi:hypothetical protein